MRKKELIDKIIELEKRRVPTRKELEKFDVQTLKEWLEELEDEEAIMEAKGDTNGK